MEAEDITRNREKAALLIVFSVALVAGSHLDSSGFTGAEFNHSISSNSTFTNLSTLSSEAQGSIQSIYSHIYTSLRDPREFNGSRYSTSVVKANPPENLERIYRSNIDVMKSSHGRPPFRVDTNSRGLREEEFNDTAPENTTRILVIGDSYVYGSGVNESDRYTDLLEDKLNNRSENRYQVINAGIIGAGAKDYYLFFKHRGIHYNPDMVIIGVIGNDWMPLELEKEFSRKASDYVNRKYPDASDERKNQLSSERFLELQGKNQDVERYSVLSNISALAAQNDIETIVFASDYMAKNKTEQVEKHGDTVNSTLVRAPKEFRDDWQSDFCLKYSPNRISTLDPHPSPEGHRMLADRLYRQIKEKEEPLIPWAYGGFDQWIDPC